jgi:adenosylcobinamide kinase/adenosylcobinamide-phosphate guanylyltransferase
MSRLVLIIGGAGSGKSEYAENAALGLYESHRKISEENHLKNHLWYLATMKVCDNETRRKIQKHLIRRENTAFETVELPRNIGNLDAGRDDVILLECISNLLANEMFPENETDECADYGGRENENQKTCVERILQGIDALRGKCDMVVVSNEVSLDGCDYDETTREYIAGIAEINRRLSAAADEVTEVVAGIPVCIKK